MPTDSQKARLTNCSRPLESCSQIPIGALSRITRRRRSEACSLRSATARSARVVWSEASSRSSSCSTLRVEGRTSNSSKASPRATKAVCCDQQWLPKSLEQKPANLPASMPLPQHTPSLRWYRPSQWLRTRKTQRCACASCSTSCQSPQPAAAATLRIEAKPRAKSGSRAKITQSSSTLRRPADCSRSEEHTSELQSQFHLVCRLLLEKK